MRPMTIMRKIKQFKLALLGMKVKKCMLFPTCVKLKVGSEIWIGIKMEGCIRIRIGINTIPIYNTAYWL
jgi:hypothetical protein